MRLFPTISASVASKRSQRRATCEELVRAQPPMLSEASEAMAKDARPAWAAAGALAAALAGMALAALLAACVGPPDPLPPLAASGRGVRFGGRPASDPVAVAEVLAGKRRTANAAWWGFDPEDATAALQAAIDSGAAVVEVPDMGSPWIVGPIELAGDQEIVFEQGVVVEAKRGAFRGRTDHLFSGDRIANVSLRGHGAVLRMHKADYTAPPYEPSEWRHALSFSSVRNLLIEGLRIESSGGDGIYVGSKSAAGVQAWSEDVTIRDVVLVDHHRQGVSVVSVRRLLIEDSVIVGTRGTPPQAGIDFEPNQPYQRLEDCVVRRTRIEGNSGAGIQVFLRKLDASSAPVSITVESCTIRRNGVQLWITPAGGSPSGVVRLIGNRVGWPVLIERGGLLAVEQSP